MSSPMTNAAWAMLVTTWGVVGFLTGRFFWLVLRTPSRPADDDASEERPPKD
jgi:hypothetical protein